MPHSNGCRARFEKLLSDEERAKTAKKRSDDFITKVIEADDEKRNPKKAKTDENKPEERAAEDVPVESESDEESEGEGKIVPSDGGENPGTGRRVRRKIINLLEGGSSTRVKDQRKVADDEDEMKWAAILVHAVEGKMMGEESQRIYDDLTGKELNPEKVKAAREGEMDFVKKIQVYEERSIEECWEKTGKRPIPTRWVDILKGEDERSRWVAQDFKGNDKNRDDLFASMPPLEAKKALFRMGAIRMKNRPGKRKMKMLFIDVKKAHLNAECTQENVFVELPTEASAQPGMCGMLKRWLYGMRGAAKGWEGEFTEKLESIGFKRGRSNPVAFCRASDETSLVVHGDDFTFLGYEEALEEMKTELAKWWEIKVRGTIGDDPQDDKEIVILNRTIRWNGDSLNLQPDPKHRTSILEAFGLKDDSKGLTIPSDRDEVTEEQDADLLNPFEATQFRSLGARANYLGLDRPDIQFATKEICRGMAKPSRGGMIRMKRLARYLLEVPDPTIRYDSCERSLDKILVYVDSDWAGCKATRKSTSGGAVTWGGGLLKSWSRSQGPIAISSGEAEFYAAIKGACEGLGIKSLLEDLGFYVQVEVIQDSTAAKGTASRAGIGRIKHLDVGWCWIQQTVESGKIKLMKINGTVNPADFLTKPKSAKETARLSEALNFDMPTRKEVYEFPGIGVLEVSAWIREAASKRETMSKKK